MLGIVDAPISDTEPEIGHRGETVIITFRGGTMDFHKSLDNWLKKHPEWYCEVVSNPASARILLVVVAQDTADAIYKQLKATDPIDQPDGLYVAAVPEKGRRSKRFVRGTDADTYDPTKQRMAQAGRKVGITPRQLAERGGW